MKANELRIGNLVIDHHFKPHKITASCIVAQSQFDIANARGYTSIDLTEEILLKCGFIHGIVPYVFNYAVADWYHIAITKEGFILRGLGASIVKVKHLHHLQNLIYALTREELPTSKLL